MQRLLQQQSEVIGEALAHLPDRLLPLVEFDLFCGDPIFAGLNAARWPNERNHTITHVKFPYHARDGRVHICCPEPIDLGIAIHEIGHVIEWRVRERSTALPVLTPVNEYAASNYSETFAEAFAQWFWPPEVADTDPYWTHWDRGNCEFFDRLGAV